MDHQQTGKRSLALPITLVLLVLSLMGNVLLYTLHLQNTQQTRFNTGQKIYAAAIESKLYFDEIISNTDALLSSKRAEERLETKYNFGRAGLMGTGVSELISHADLLAPANEGKLDPEPVMLFINNVDAALRAVGNYDGPLTEADRAYLLSLKATLEQMAEEIGGINTNLGDNRSAITRLASGLEWSEHVVRLHQMIVENPSKHPGI